MFFFWFFFQGVCVDANCLCAEMRMYVCSLVRELELFVHHSRKGGQGLHGDSGIHHQPAAAAGNVARYNRD